MGWVWVVGLMTHHHVVRRVVRQQQEGGRLVVLGHVGRGDHRLLADVVRSLDGGADGEREVEGACESVCRVVGDTRGALNGDDVRDTRLDKGLRRGFREARGHEDKLQRGNSTRLQQLAQLLHTDKVRGASAVLHGQVRRVAVARVVQADAAAQRDQRA